MNAKFHHFSFNQAAFYFIVNLDFDGACTPDVTSWVHCKHSLLLPAILLSAHDYVYTV